MNYLKDLMDAKGITPIELAEMTGISVSNIRLMLNDNRYETAFKSTQMKIADALGVSVCDLVKGGKRMKDTILETEIKKATEHLARLLRNYSESELYLHVTIFTKDKECMDDDFKGEVPDYYSYRLNDLSVGEVDVGETLMTDSGRIYYAGVDGQAYIKKVVPYHQKGGKHYD